MNTTERCIICKLSEAETELDVPWTCCDNCQKWGHNDCLGIEVPKSQNDPYSCPRCVQRQAEGPYNGNANHSVSNAVIVTDDDDDEDDDTAIQVAQQELQKQSEQLKILKNREQKRRQLLELRSKLAEQQKEIDTLLANELKLVEQTISNVNSNPRQTRMLDAVSGTNSGTSSTKATTSTPNKVVFQPTFTADAALTSNHNDYVQPPKFNSRFSRNENQPSLGGGNAFTTTPTWVDYRPESQQQFIAGLLEQQMRIVNRQFMAKLPKFRGEEDKWPNFLAQYNRTTQLGGFESDENISRLQECLEGDALAAVQGALLIPNNANEVMRILIDKYGDEERIVRKKLRTLDNLQSPNETKPFTVIRFYESLRNLHAILSQLQATAYLSSPMLMDRIFDKLSMKTQSMWLRHKIASHENTFVDFLRWFEPHYKIALLQDTPIETGKSRERVNTHQEVDTRINNVSTSPQKDRTNRCLFCRRQNHIIPDCFGFAKEPIKQRWSFLRERGWCYRCLMGRHLSSSCPSKSVCGVDGCLEPHHRLLHYTKGNVQDKYKDDSRDEDSSSDDGGDENCTSTNGSLNKKEKNTDTTKSEKQKKENAESTKATDSKPQQERLNHHAIRKTKTMFCVLPVTVWSGERSYKTWAFLDTGSGPTLITNNVATFLGLQGRIDPLCLVWSNGQTQHDPHSRIVSCKISGLGYAKKYRIDNVKTTNELYLPQASAEIWKMSERYNHLKEVDVPKLSPTCPEVMIGLEHTHLLTSQVTKEGNVNEPVAVLTRLGWMIFGKDTADEEKSRVMVSCNICECTKLSEETNTLIRSFQSTESFGVTPPNKTLLSRNDERALTIMNDTIKLEAGRYQIGLLWKEHIPDLPDNRAIAIRRLKCFEQKLERNPDLKKAVCEKIMSHQTKGYLERISDEELTRFSGRKWYLPLFSVVNPNKPSKIRLVFDAAAKCDDICINDCLLTGPDNLTPLFSILLRFRRGKIGFSGDIAEMYHRVKITPQDSFCQLILWRNADISKEISTYKLNVMSFGAKCSPSAAQFVKNTNAEKFKETKPRAVEAITDAHYVDDLLDSVNSPKEAVELIRDVIAIHAYGGFEIRNWICNDKEVLRKINNHRGDHEEIDLNMGEDATEKVLGMFWDVSQDVFVFKLSPHKMNPDILSKRQLPTKREVLRIIMSLFDPLGMLATLVLPAKVFNQRVCRAGYEWDEKIKSDLVPLWYQWLDSLEAIKQVKVPRWYSTVLDSNQRIELHVFGDASELAFSAVAYLRISDKNGNNPNTVFVSAKSRVAPHKSLSIPRLELQGGLLATRLKNTIMTEIRLPFERIIMWTDSQTLLGWIRSTNRRYNSFVAHRVGEILDSTEPSDWRWVPSKQNPADYATKWQGIPSIPDEWFIGPTFLRESHNEWPIEKIKIDTTNEEELKPLFSGAHQSIDHSQMFSPGHFSRWQKLLRTAAYVLRFIKRTKPSSVARNIIEKHSNTDVFSGAELEEAEIMLIRICQKEEFANEIDDLRRKGSVKKSSKLYRLTPIIDNGLLRVKTRLDAAPSCIDADLKQPLILPGNHFVTKLIVEAIHRKYKHSLTEATVTELRQRFWIPKIRVVVYSVIKNCQLCVLKRAKPSIPTQGNLPKSRLAPYKPPFTYTGLDYLGPFEVAVGRRREKRWLALFTCLTMRAIHLEIAHSLNTDSAIMCLSRFINRRGMPLEIISDNGTNFRAAEKELRTCLNQLDRDRLVNETQALEPTVRKLTWRFNPPSAPHFGGAWERLVRIVKNGIYGSLKSKIPRDEVFQTVITEVETMVNSRPLNYTSVKDLTYPPITPNCLLKMNDRVQTTFDPTQYNIRKQWHNVHVITQLFWKRWIREYLPTIATKTKWFDDQKPLEVGQLVLILEDNVPRGEWRRAVVEKVHPGADGRVRVATVRTAKKSYQRPVAKLAVLKTGIDIL